MILEKDGLQLVPAHTDLADPLVEYYIRNKDFLEPFDPKREPEFFTREHQLSILKKEMDDWDRKTACRFYIKLASCPDEIIGSFSIGNIVWGAFCSAFLGAKLDYRYINRGYMTTVLNMIVDYAFNELKLHRLEANVMPRNKRSLRVLEKCNFEYEGISRYYLQINGVWEDHVHMVKLNYAMHENR